jgi:hypothetical protein
MSGASPSTAQQDTPERAPAGDPVVRGVLGTVPTANWRAVGALARLDGRRLLRHPLFLAGVGLFLLGSANFFAEALRDPAASWSEDGWTVFIGASMIGLLTMVAANYATLRDRREHTEEQHESLPVGEAGKTGGLLLATLGPALVAAVLLAAVAGYAGTLVRIDGHEAIHLGERVLVVVMLGTLGIAIARWIPNPFVAPLVAWGIVFGTNSESTSWWQVLSPFTHVDSLEGWHLLYVVGLTAFFCAGALLKRSRRLSFIAVGIFGLAIVSVSLAFLL